MNPYESQHPYPHPTAVPPPPAKKRRRWVTPLVGVAGLVAGAALAGAAGATADPEVITETETVTETVTETEYIVPDSCLAAISEARAGFTVAADAMMLLGPAVEAAAYYDLDALAQSVADMESLNGQLDRNDFAAQAAACEEAAR